ncbi:divalent-cation tolerance protein CutA [Candidatus Woesearchaeota archaeon CG10_big_fil_rev_8_21_14_0_10_45_16]|nr:MAG: divalent-cation tolerance protein CutA [Candidatus Woesearchaeota archaeon CG10_big_fil_rev_8_21_14_0_10_45_16]
MMFVYTTLSTEQEAKRISTVLIEKKLIACANLFPIQSIYAWEGSVKEEPEYVVLMKTTSERAEDAKAELEKIHPYEVPCICLIPADSTKPFAGWLLQATAHTRTSDR